MARQEIPMATSFALTITKSGSGTSPVKNDSEETINSESQGTGTLIAAKL